MTITQHVTWEASHRHVHAATYDLHRHAFRLTLSLTHAPGGTATPDLVVPVLSSLVDGWQDAVLVAAFDERLQQTMRQAGRKHIVLPTETTAEALSRYVVDYVCLMAAPRLRSHGVRAVQVRLHGAAFPDSPARDEHGQAHATLGTGGTWGLHGRAAA
jgi:hypothetical protein